MKVSPCIIHWQVESLKRVFVTFILKDQGCFIIVFAKVRIEDGAETFLVFLAAMGRGEIYFPPLWAMLSLVSLWKRPIGLPNFFVDGKEQLFPVLERRSKLNMHHISVRTI